MRGTDSYQDVPLSVIASVAGLLAVCFVLLGFGTVGSSIFAADRHAAGRSLDTDAEPQLTDAPLGLELSATDGNADNVTHSDAVGVDSATVTNEGITPAPLDPDFGPGPSESAGPATESPLGPTAIADGAGSTVLRLVYFVEADRDHDPLAVDAIERQAIALQSFWFQQFGGTFRLPANVDVVYGDHAADWYAETPDGDDERWFRLSNIRREVERKLGLADSDDDVRLLTFPEARIDGRVGANRYEGAWMDGDDIRCIDGTVDTTPYTPDYPAGCLATVAHELGHVYGLGHEGPDDDCMQFGFYQYMSGWQLCDFSDDNRRLVTSDPRNVGWLDAEPGDRSGS